MTDYWSETIKSFEGLISYPRLEEKYLKRPPFKYLFSIFVECMKVSSLGEDQFSEEELDKEKYDSSEKKLDFIKKMFKIVYSNKTDKIPVKA